VLAALFGAVACVAVVAMTAPPGPGLDPDSASYLGAAESVLRTGAVRAPFAAWSSADSTSPLAHFPPGFSLAIAGIAALGLAPVQAARAIEAAAAFVTVGGGVWLVAGVAGSGAGAVAGIVLLASPSLAFDHWQVLSEPLFLALLVAALALMSGAARPWTYGLAAAAAALVRYAGAAALGAAVLWAFGRTGAIRVRARRAAEAALPGILLEGAWMLREAAESSPVRSFGPRGDLGPTIRQLGETLGSWLAPLVGCSWVQVPLALAVTAAAAALLWAAARGSGTAEAGRPSAACQPQRFLAAAGLLAVCYAAVVVWSRLFVDEGIPFDGRLLSPFVLLAELGTAAAFGAGWPAWRRRGRLAAAAAALVWVSASATATVEAVQDALDGGWGYASDEWRASPLVHWLRGPGSGAAIFSNNPATVYALLHRPSRTVPADLAADSVTAFGRAFRAQRGILVRFPFDLDPGVPPDSLARRLGLREIAVFSDGAVWGAAPEPPARGR